MTIMLTLVTPLPRKWLGRYSQGMRREGEKRGGKKGKGKGREGSGRGRRKGKKEIWGLDGASNASQSVFSHPNSAYIA